MKEIQRILSSCHSSQAAADSSPEEAWAWVRLVVHKICALGSFVKALHRDELPSEDDAALMFAFLNAAVELIVPSITTGNTLSALVLNEDELKDLISALDQIKAMIPHGRAPPEVFRSTRLLLAHLRATAPSSEDWSAKHVSIMSRRRKFAEMLLTLEDWAAGRRCRGSAMDHIMDQFETNVQSSMSLWDLSRDVIVQDCIATMGNILPTLGGPIMQTAERQLRLDAWKNAFEAPEKAAETSSTGYADSREEPGAAVEIKVDTMDFRAPVSPDQGHPSSSTPTNSRDPIDELQRRVSTCLEKAGASAAGRGGSKSTKTIMVSLLEPLAQLSQLPKAQVTSEKVADLIVDPFRQALIIALDLFATRRASPVQAGKAGNKLLKALDKAFRMQPVLKPLFAEYVG